MTVVLFDKLKKLLKLVDTKLLMAAVTLAAQQHQHVQLADATLALKLLHLQLFQLKLKLQNQLLHHQNLLKLTSQAESVATNHQKPNLAHEDWLDYSACLTSFEYQV